MDSIPHDQQDDLRALSYPATRPPPIKVSGAARLAFIQDRLVLGKWRRGPLIGLITTFVLLTGVFDISTGPYLGPSIFYLIPVALAAWHLSKKAGILTSIACAAMWLFVDLLTQLPNYYLVLQLWNAAVRLGVFSIVATLLSSVRSLTDNLEESVQERTMELRREIAERRKLEQEMIGLIRRHERAVAHELHDGLAQSLTGISCKAKLLEQDLEESSSPYARQARDIARHLSDAIAQTRDIARGLDPVEVEANELGSALQRLVMDITELFQIDCSLHVGGAPIVVDGLTGLHLYRIAQQAIDNALRHGAPEHIDVDLQRTETELTLSISDDGTGFNPQAHFHRGLGVRSMKFRAELLGGELTISSAEDTGTRVECRIPEVPLSPVAD